MHHVTDAFIMLPLMEISNTQFRQRAMKHALAAHHSQSMKHRCNPAHCHPWTARHRYLRTPRSAQLVAATAPSNTVPANSVAGASAASGWWRSLALASTLRNHSCGASSGVMRLHDDNDDTCKRAPRACDQDACITDINEHSTLRQACEQFLCRRQLTGSCRDHQGPAKPAGTCGHT